LTDNIQLLTQTEINKLCQHNNTEECYGTHEKDIYGESIVKLGHSNKTPKRTEQTINHESIHETLTDLFNSAVSFLFDRGLYYNFESLTKGEFINLEIRQALIEFFTIDDICLI
jgi:hypothetical protein